jgi:hypothetical protein
MPMNFSDIPHQRLYNQRLTGTPFETAVDSVRWLMAVQSQDYAGAKWGLGQRSHGLTDADFDTAFNSGAILRTHVMRPTWHFVLPEDIRWLLMLTAPRVHQANAYMYRKLELDDTVFEQSNRLIADALRGGNHLMREELAAILQAAGIDTSDRMRLSYIMMRAELDAVICSGARRGKQFTYALLDERAPNARTLDYDDALAEFTQRYFTTRGPATLKDFCGWSGLTMAEAKAGVSSVTPEMESERIEGQMMWFAASTPAPQAAPPALYLLPNYDEYISSYSDYSAVFDPNNADHVYPNSEFVFGHFIVIDGQVSGTWKRTLKKSMVTIEFDTFGALTDDQLRAFAAAAQRFGEFIGLQVEIPGEA